MAVNRVVRAASRVARTPDSRTRSQAKAANKAAANRVVAEANRAAKRKSRSGEHSKAPRKRGFSITGPAETQACSPRS